MQRNKQLLQNDLEGYSSGTFKVSDAEVRKSSSLRSTLEVKVEVQRHGVSGRKTFKQDTTQIGSHLQSPHLQNSSTTENKNIR